MKIKKFERGFTLIELLIVMSIISILFLVLIPQVNGAILKARETGIKTDFHDFQSASELLLRENSGKNINIDTLNQYLDKNHTVTENSGILQTKSEDSWGNKYIAETGNGKISFSSLGQKEDAANKVYQLFSYYYRGVVFSCTKGFQVNNIPLETTKVPSDFSCGDDLPLIPNNTSPEPPPVAPTTPTNFVVSTKDSESITLSWDSSTDSTQYELMRDGVKIYTGNLLTYRDNGLSSGTSYTYSLVAKNDNGSSSPATLTTTTEIIPLSAPINFRVINVTDSSITLAWTNNQAYYDAYIYESNFEEYYTPSVTQGSKTMVIEGLSPSVAYSFRMTVFDEAYAGNSTELVNATTNASTVVDSTNPTVQLPTEKNGSCFVIRTVGQLQAIKLNLNGCFELGNDIDATGTLHWNTMRGFEPIGNSMTPFTGTLDGKNYEITSLNITRNTQNYVGLFGYLSNGSIQNLALVNTKINGKDYTGGFIGYNDGGKITNSYVAGSVTGAYRTGGLVGYNNGYGGEADLTNVYSVATVTGTSRVGGLVGHNDYNGGIINSYAAGKVSGNSDLGGITGYNTLSSDIGYAYWDKEYTYATSSNGGYGRTTVQMKTQSTYVGWNFSSIWAIHPSINNGYPYLRSFAP